MFSNSRDRLRQIWRSEDVKIHPVADFATTHIEKPCLVHLETICWRSKWHIPLITMTHITKFKFGNLSMNSWCQAFDFVYLIPMERAILWVQVIIFHRFIFISFIFVSLGRDSIQCSFFWFCFVLFVCLTSNHLFTCSCHAVCWSHWSGSLTPSPTCWWRENFPAAGSPVWMSDSEPTKTRFRQTKRAQKTALRLLKLSS